MVLVELDEMYSNNTTNIVLWYEIEMDHPPTPGLRIHSTKWSAVGEYDPIDVHIPHHVEYHVESGKYITRELHEIQELDDTALEHYVQRILMGSRKGWFVEH